LRLSACAPLIARYFIAQPNGVEDILPVTPATESIRSSPGVTPVLSCTRGTASFISAQLLLIVLIGFPLFFASIKAFPF